MVQQDHEDAEEPEGLFEAVQGVHPFGSHFVENCVDHSGRIR